MKKRHKKAASGIILAACMMFAVYGLACVSDKAEDMGVPVSLTGISSEKPVIILDAGQGESSWHSR